MSLALATFLLLGVVLVLPGSTQGPLAAQLGLDLEETGLLAAALSAGLGLGTVGAGPFVDRLPRRPLFVVATAAGAASLWLAADASGLAGVAAGVAGAAFSLGVLETGVNAVLAARYPRAAARAVAAAHMAVTLGAVATPVAFALVVGGDAWQGAFRLAAGGLAVLALAFAAAPQPAPTGPPDDPESRLRLRSLTALGAVSACYVGFETALTVFAVPFAATARDLPPSAGLAAISGLWLGIGIGRGAMAAWPRPLRERHLASFMLLAALLLAATLALPALPPALGFAAVGVAMGGVFPLLIALAMSRAPGAEGTAGGLVAGCGSLGGFTIPWLTGLFGDAHGAEAAVAGLALWPLTAAAIAALDARSRRRSRVRL